jgi:hypothetical protein
LASGLLELISVHVPKCAGTALRTALARAYGADHLHLDYADRPFDPTAPMHADPAAFFGRTPEIPSAARVVHGHFHAGKYQSLPRSVRRIAILRHPVARTISHYNYWRRLAPAEHTLHRSVMEAALCLADFARLPFIRHAYAGVMFAGLRRDDFDFIGTMETLDVDLPRLVNLLGRPLDLAVENVGDTVRPPSDVGAALAALLAEDIALYENWRHA